MIASAAAEPPPAPGEAEGPPAIGGLVPERLEPRYTAPTRKTKTVRPSAQRGSPGRVAMGACGVMRSAARRRGGRCVNRRHGVFGWTALGVEQEDIDQQRESAQRDQAQPARRGRAEGEQCQV